MITDPNMIEDNEYIGLSPLTIDDLRNFFNTYIKPFAPYQEEKIYDTLINNLVEYYCNQTYFNIPAELKEIFEETNIASAKIYDQLLIAIGVPETVIYQLSNINKVIFLKTLSDFERYKGTVSFFQKVINAFGDRINIYELFIDLEGSDWVFKPVRLYLHDDVPETLDSIPYATIYNAVPSLILNEEQLTTLHADEKLILPIKSNILFLDNDLTTDVSILYDVIVAIFLHTYKDNYIDLYFKDDVKAVQLKTIYFLWYYLLTEYYDIPWTAFSSQVMLRFIYGDLGFPAFIGTIPTTIYNLDQIIDKYNAIQIVNTPTRDYDNQQTLRDNFFRDISQAFYNFADGSATTANDMYNELVIMNSQLITYISDRIANTSIGEKSEINLILTEIYSSLILYSSVDTGDIYFNEYVDYFLRYLSQIIINPEKTTSYTILYNLKPYHVELYSEFNTGIRCEDKFNQIFIDDEKNTSFLYKVSLASVMTLSSDYLHDFSYITETQLSITEDIVAYDIIMDGLADLAELSELISVDPNIISASMGTISDDYTVESDVLGMLGFEELWPGTNISGPGIFNDVTFSAGSDPIVTAHETPGPDFTGVMSACADPFTHTDPFRADFLIPNVNSVSVTMGDYNADIDNVFLRAYNSSNILLDEATGSIGASESVILTVNSLSDDIAYVLFGSTGSYLNSIYFDNFTYIHRST